MEWIPIRVLLYQSAVDGKPVDNVIGEWTWFWNAGLRKQLSPEQQKQLRKWSHAEMWLPDVQPDGPTWKDKGHYSGDCSTSTMGAIRDPNSTERNGTVRRPSSTVLVHPERWSVSESIWLPRPVYQSLVTYIAVKVLNNKGYDRRAILSFATPVRFHRGDQEICSEHVDDNLKKLVDYFVEWFMHCPLSEQDQWPLRTLLVLFLNAYTALSQTEILSPLRLGIYLMLSGISIHDLKGLRS